MGMGYEEKIWDDFTRQKIQAANIPPRLLAHCGIEKFVQDANAARLYHLEKARIRAVEYLGKVKKALYSQSGTMLGLDNTIIIGNIGAGKSSLAAAILHSIISLNKEKKSLPLISGRWMNALELLARIIEAFRTNGNESTEAIIEEATEPTVLVIDDLGIKRGRSASNDDWAQQVFYRILNRRDENGLPTIATINGFENARLDAVRQIGDRAASRLFSHAEIIQIKGEDLRNER